MPLLVLLVALALARLVWRDPARRAWPVLVGLVLLAPAPLVVPNGSTPLPTLLRVVAAVAAVALLRHDRTLFRRTPAHRPALAWLAALVVATVALAPRGGPDQPALAALGPVARNDLAGLLEPVLLFAVALAALRALPGERWVRDAARPVVVAALALAGLALAERLTQVSWGELLGAGGPLEQRAGEPRARGSQEFALALAWVLAACAPLVLAVLVRTRWRVVGVGLMGGAALVTYSRSAPAAFTLGLAVLLALDRDRRAARAVGLLAVPAGLALLVPQVAARFTSDVDAGALAVRVERLPVLLGEAAQRPWHGLGLRGIEGLGFPAADNAYLLAYVETGVLAAAALVVLLVVATLQGARAALLPRSPERTLWAAATAGAVVLLGAGFAFDALQTRGSADLLALLLALATAVAGRARPPRGWRARDDVPAVRLALVSGGLLVGLVTASAWPATTAVTVAFDTLPSARLTGPFDPVAEGRRLVATVCGVAERYDRRDDGVTVDCRDAGGPAGVGELRAAARDLDRATAALGDLAGVVVNRTPVTGLRLSPREVAPPRPPTVVRTLPGWLPWSLALLVWVVPSGPLRQLEQRLQAPSGGSRRGV